MILKLMNNAKTAAQMAVDNSEGLGRLIDTTSAKVTEERNGAYTLQFTLPIKSRHYAEIQKDSVILAKPNPYDDPQLFRVYKSTKPLNGIVTYLCNHISYDWAKTSVLPFTASTCANACAGINSNILPNNLGFTLSTDKATIANFTNEIPQSARALLAGQEGSLLDVYGGEYKFDNMNIYLLAARGADTGVKIAYGKNLTDIRQEENIEKMYTAVLPYAKRNDDETAIVGDLITLVQATEQRIMNLDLSDRFDQVEELTQQMINTAAQAYINTHDVTVPKINIKVSFVNLADTDEYKYIADLEQVKLCDSITIEFPALGISTKAKVIKTVYDVLNDRYESIELGDAASGLARTIVNMINTEKVQINQTRKFAQDAIEKATALITGGLGGYVVMGLNSNGQPEEILIMDTPDKTTATNVLRFNLAGIGFSQNGYDGPYDTAWTIDGAFNADYITTGTLDASQAEITNIDADNINTGTLDASVVTVENIDADNIKVGTLDCQTLRNAGGDVANMNASELSTGTMDNARAGGQTQNDITVVNWDGQLCHFQWENGIGADYWLESSVYWSQIYADAGGDGQRG